MSFVVLGMEMPGSCSYCDFFYDFYRCTLLDYNFYHEDGEPNVFTERLPDCPLRPLPEERGDLIDRNALLKAEWDYCDAEEAIKNAPTVIEAEGQSDE